MVWTAPLLPLPNSDTSDAKHHSSSVGQMHLRLAVIQKSGTIYRPRKVSLSSDMRYAFLHYRTLLFVCMYLRQRVEKNSATALKIAVLTPKPAANKKKSRSPQTQGATTRSRKPQDSNLLGLTNDSGSAVRHHRARLQSSKILCNTYNPVRIDSHQIGEDQRVHHLCCCFFVHSGSGEYSDTRSCEIICPKPWHGPPPPAPGLSFTPSLRGSSGRLD
jgi:hypothetical protein